MNYVSVSDAAHELGVTPQRVRALIAAQRLPAVKLGDLWAIRRRDLERFRDTPRPSGRPKS